MADIPSYDEARATFIVNGSGAFIYIAIAALIWIILFLIYIPLTNGVVMFGYLATTQLISLITLFAILFLLFRALKNYVATCIALSAMTAILRAHDNTYDDFKDYSEALQYLLFIVSLVVVYVFLWPLFSFAIGPLNGVVLTVLIFWILWMLAKIFIRFDRIEKRKVEKG